MKDTKFDETIKFRAPECLREALRVASDKHLTSGSEYIRRSLVERLRADGIDPHSFEGAAV